MSRIKFMKVTTNFDRFDDLTVETSYYLHKHFSNTIGLFSFYMLFFL